MAFLNSAVGVLQILVVALGAGLGIWGAINLTAARLSTTMDIYTHIRQDRLTETSAAVNKAINSIR